MSVGIHQEFKQFELDHSLFDLTINDLPIWERLRFRVFRKIQQEYTNPKSESDENSMMKTYFYALSLAVKNGLYKNPFLAEDAELMFVNRSRRKKMEDGYWWDLYMDPLYSSFSFDYIHLEKPYNYKHKVPAKTENRRYLDIVEFGGTLQRKLDIASHTLPTQIKRKLQKVENALDHQFDINVDLTALAQRSLNERKAKLWMYQRLLKQIDPNLVVLVCSYGEETLIEACQKEGVTVVELQHGVIHENHFGYSFPGPRDKKMFPDYLLVWGEHWKEAAEFPLPGKCVIPVGYPYLEQSVEKYGNEQSREQILFISQGSIGEKLSKFALEVDKHSGITHDIVYKLHPSEYGQWREQYPWLIDADLEIIGESGRPLYQLFSESRVQIGVYSTAIYEGLCFNLETYLYNCSNSNILEPLITEGAATLVNTADQLVSELGDDSHLFEREYYFTSDATENVHNVIRELNS